MKDAGKGNDKVSASVQAGVAERGFARKVWTIRKYANDEAFANGEPFEVSQFEGNVWLEEGIAIALQLIGGTAAPTQYDNTNARLGVGDSATAEAASQTGLQAATNTAYVGMEAGYPQITDQTITWRAVFDGSTANFDWNEFTVVNAADDNGDNFNRKVSDQGTKASGQTWTLDLDFTLS